MRAELTAATQGRARQLSRTLSCRFSTLGQSQSRRSQYAPVVSSGFTRRDWTEELCVHELPLQGIVLKQRRRNANAVEDTPPRRRGRPAKPSVPIRLAAPSTKAFQQMRIGIHRQRPETLGGGCVRAEIGDTKAVFRRDLIRLLLDKLV